MAHTADSEDEILHSYKFMNTFSLKTAAHIVNIWNVNIVGHHTTGPEAQVTCMEADFQNNVKENAAF